MRRSLILLLFMPVLIALVGCEPGKTPSPAPDSLKQDTTPTDTKTIEITLLEACNGCHGKNGLGTKPGVPFIAGLSATYLESAMRSYLIGDRKHEIMRQAVLDLEVSDRQELAEHFAQLKTPWKGGAQSSKANTKQAKPKAVRAGQALSKPCAGCHGKDGNSTKAGVPSLAGLQPAYFIPALKAYLMGERRGAAIMKNFKLSLSQQDINNLAAYFSVQQRLRSPLGGKLNPADASDALAHRCLGCHGRDGNSTHPAMPSLAGQNASYLIKAMQTYRDRKRREKMMVDVAKGLSDDAIQRNAIYFATRTPAKVVTGTAKSTKFDPMGDGEKLAASCNGCHGPKGVSNTQGTPSLAGQQEAYLRSAITTYRNGERQHPMMQTLTRYLSDTDIEKLGFYYGSQTPQASKLAFKGNAKTGETLAESCAGCHGKDGNSQDAKIPSLAGQNAAYLVAAIKAYANDTRQHEDMKNAVQELDKTAMRNIAKFYAQLTPKGSAVHVPEAPEALAQKCNRCHGENGQGSDDDKLRLDGQRQSYLVKALLAYKNGERINSMMQAMSAELGIVEIEAIAAYYAQR